MPDRTSRAGSLRTGFLSSLLLTALVPIVLIGGISIYTIHLVLDRTVEAGIRDDVTQIECAVESHLQNLDYVSRQFAFNDRMAINFSRYFRSESVMERYRYKRDILEITNLAMNPNPQCSIAFYYFVGENRPLFGNAVTNTPLQLAGRSALKEGPGWRTGAPDTRCFSDERNTKRPRLRRNAHLRRFGTGGAALGPSDAPYRRGLLQPQLQRRRASGSSSSLSLPILCPSGARIFPNATSSRGF